VRASAIRRRAVGFAEGVFVPKTSLSTQTSRALYRQVVKRGWKKIVRGLLGEGIVTDEFEQVSRHPQVGCLISDASQREMFENATCTLPASNLAQLRW
jgi:hypothetical protein